MLQEVIMGSTIITAIIGAIAPITESLIKIFSGGTRQGKKSANALSPSSYGITIVTPAEYDWVDNAFPVNGTYENLPEGYELWVSTFGIVLDDKDNRTKQYWPQERANANNGKWYSKV